MSISLDFKGTGSMAGFVDDASKMANAFSNPTVVVGNGWSGPPPVVSIVDGSFEIDFSACTI